MVLSIIADILGIIDFVLTAIILSFFRKNQRQKKELKKYRKIITEELSALLENIEEDQLISATIQDDLRECLYWCREFWSVFNVVGIYHINHCLHLLKKNDFLANESMIRNHTVYLITKLKRGMKE